jgi:hypothetical protein
MARRPSSGVNTEEVGVHPGAVTHEAKPDPRHRGNRFSLGA